MSIKAGRVGVNPSQVNPVDGSIISDATAGYTKQEADAKFETQSNASTERAKLQPKTLELPLETLIGSKLTVEDSLDALNEIQKTRQPKTLAVPISMLQGSLLVPKTTVEDVIQTMNNAMTNKELTDMMIPIDGSSDITSEFTINAVKTKLMKIGKIVFMDLRIEEITANAWATLATIPDGFRPAMDVNDLNLSGKHSTVGTSGVISCADTFSNGTFIMHTSWMTS